MNLFGDPETRDDDDYLTDPDEDGFSLFDDEGDYGPVADTPSVETLAPPQSNPNLLAHHDIERNMLDLWYANRLPHAMIFNGLKGIGKSTFAYRLARFVLRNSDPENQSGGLLGDMDDVRAETMDISPEDPVFRKVTSGGHGDLLVITKPADKKTIPAEDVRKIAPFLRQTSSSGGWQVVIIDDAELMTNQAQNALLKILEEPPARALIILVTHGAGGLLPTIRSRSRFVPFAPLSDDDIQTLLKKSSGGGLPSQDLTILTALSRGSAGQGIALLQEGGIETIHHVLDCLSSIHTVNANQINLFSLEIGKSGADNVIQQFNYIVRWWFETMVRQLAMGENKYHLGNITLQIPPKHTLQSFLRLHEAVEEHIKICEHGNLDKRYMVFKTLRMIQNDSE